MVVKTISLTNQERLKTASNHLEKKLVAAQYQGDVSLFAMLVDMYGGGGKMGEKKME